MDERAPKLPFWIHQIVEYGLGVLLVFQAVQSPRPVIPLFVNALERNLRRLTAGLGPLEVPGRHVEGITGLQHLLLAVDGEGHPSLEHVPPVRAVALVVR